MPSPASSPTRDLIAANVDRAIRAAGKTNREVGELIGVTEHQIWRWRKGKAEPSGRYVAALASILFDDDISALYAAPADDSKAAAA